MGYIDHRRLIHSEAKKIGENHFALCSGHHVLIAPLSHANLSRSEHENLESDCPSTETPQVRSGGLDTPMIRRLSPSLSPTSAHSSHRHY